VGLLRGGRIRSLATLRFRLPGLVFAGLMIQVGIGVLGTTSTWRLIALLSSYGLLGAWLAINVSGGRRWCQVGLACVAAGYALNLLAIIPNASMPVSLAALRLAGGSRSAFHQTANLDKHIAIEEGAVLPSLGDVYAIPLLGAVISIGDLAMLVGVAVVLSEGMVSR